jgi:hypothetical protein
MTALTTAFTKKMGSDLQSGAPAREHHPARRHRGAGNRFDVDVFETDGVAMEAIHREAAAGGALAAARRPMPQAIRPHKEWIGGSDFHRRLQHPLFDQEDDLPKSCDDLTNRSGRASLASGPPTMTGSQLSSVRRRGRA